MVESILFFVLGFLAASLGALAFLRAAWSRAVRLTTLRVVSRLPVSPAMIAADRDRLRAEHAVDIRRLERRVEQLGSAGIGVETISTSDKAAIRRLSAELNEARARLGEIEVERLGEVQQAPRPASSPLRETIWAASRRALELARAGVAHLPVRRESADASPAKVAALEAEVHSLLSIVSNLETELAQRGAVPLPDEPVRPAEPPVTVPVLPVVQQARQPITQDEEFIVALAEQAADLEKRLAAELAGLAASRAEIGRLESVVAARESELAARLAEASARDREQAGEIERLRADRESTAAELAATLDMLRAERAGFDSNVEQLRADDNQYLREQLDALAERLVLLAGGDPSAPTASEAAQEIEPMLARRG